PPVLVRSAAQSQRRGELEEQERALAARRAVPALLRPALHARARLDLRQRPQLLHPDLRRAELRARADAPPARPARRLRVEVGTDRADVLRRRPERVHERERRDVLLRLRLHRARRLHVDPDHPVARPARCAVNRALLAVVLAGAALAGCGTDLDEPWQLEHDRIIAVRAEPPRILPGEQARIDLFLGFETEQVTSRSPDVASVVAPMSLADTMAVDAGNWIVTAPSEERLAAARVELGLEPGAPVPLQIGVAVAWPTPVMSPQDGFLAATKT